MRKNKECVSQILSELVNNNVGFFGEDLSYCDIRFASLQTADLTSASFTGSDLRGSDFNSACLTGTDFSQSNLLGVNFGVLPFTQHSDAVTALACSPDSKWIASGSRDHKLILWNFPHAWQELWGHTDSISSIEFSPSGNWVASGSLDKTIRLWEVELGVLIRKITAPYKFLLSVSFSEDGRWIASENYAQVSIWETKTGKLVFDIDGHSRLVSSVVFSGKQLITGSFDGIVRVWQIDTHRVKYFLRGHSRSITSVRCSTALIASSSLDCSIRIWDLSSGAHKFTLKGHSDVVTCVRFSASGNRLVSGSKDKSIKLWDPFKGDLLYTCLGHRADVNCVSLSSAGILSGGNDCSVILWEFWEFKACEELDAVTCVKLFDDWVLTGHANGYALVWDRTSAKVMKRMNCKHAVSSLDVSFDKTYFVSCDLWVTIWDVEYLIDIFHIFVKAQIAVFDPHGKWVIAGDAKGLLHIIEVDSGSVINSFPMHGTSILSIGFCLNRLVVSYCSNKTIGAWDLFTGKFYRSQEVSAAFVGVNTDGEIVILAKKRQKVKFYNEMNEVLPKRLSPDVLWVNWRKFSMWEMECNVVNKTKFALAAFSSNKAVFAYQDKYFRLWKYIAD